MAICDPDQRRLRALMMLEMRIKSGLTHAELAKEFNVSENTVKRTLSWAKKADLVVDAEDKILQELVPAAHKALLDALTSDNDKVKATAAIEVFKGILPSFKKTPTASGVTSSHDELGRYIEQLRAGLGVIDGEVAGEPQKSLPPATTEPAPQGTPDSTE